MKLTKIIVTCLLVLALGLSLCACGASEAEKARPAGMESTLPSAQSSEHEQTPADIARGLIGAEVEELYAAIGEPLSANYAPSCLGPGEDGELTYDGFIVYTYREEGSETVEDVDTADSAG